MSGVATVQDPEIPRGRQRVAFEADGGEPGLHWVLDGVELSLAPSPFLWEPRPGRHTLALRAEVPATKVYLDTCSVEHDNPTHAASPVELPDRIHSRRGG